MLTGVLLGGMLRDVELMWRWVKFSLKMRALMSLVLSWMIRISWIICRCRRSLSLCTMKSNVAHAIATLTLGLVQDGSHLVNSQTKMNGSSL